MKRTTVISVSVLTLLLAVLAFLFAGRDREDVSQEVRSRAKSSKSVKASESGRTVTKRKIVSDAEAEAGAESNPSSEHDSDEGSAILTEEEKREAEEDALVEGFDALTDKWTESKESGVSMKDVDEFSESFRKIPSSRKEECLHRALNLIPDENVMLLAGILFDKSQDKELLETVFNDILNRDESVKKPILEQLFKDKKHPCRADAAWILDVTGNVPEAD